MNQKDQHSSTTPTREQQSKQAYELEYQVLAGEDDH